LCIYALRFLLLDAFKKSIFWSCMRKGAIALVSLPPAFFLGQ
jgi:hypothetical protein